MHNKQNQQSQKQNPSIYHTHKPKSRLRAPLSGIQSQHQFNFNNIKLCTPHDKDESKDERNFNFRGSIGRGYSKQLLGSHCSEVSVQLRQKFRLIHLSSVHQLIASARQKKSQIEDLLRKEQLKSQMDDIDQTQLSGSLRKLKKVVRLMEIVCKIILGRSEQNGYIDLVSQQDISMRDMHSMSMDNYERELRIKDAQISRLKKLTQILSAPSISINSSKNNNNRYGIGVEEESGVTSVSPSVKDSYCVNASVGIQMVSASKEVQTEEVEILEVFDEKRQRKEKECKFKICQEYSLWNILDACQNDSQLSVIDTKNQPQLPICQLTQQQNLSYRPPKKFTLLKIHPIRVDPKSTCLKRFKSIVKIALSAINLCNNMLHRHEPTQISSKTGSISTQIQKISIFFNEKYHAQNGYYSDTFCKEVRDRINEVYAKVQALVQGQKQDSLQQEQE